MAHPADGTPVRVLLVAAIITEHQLYQAAVAARAEGERWDARAALAYRKEAMDLAAAAHTRSAACWSRARAYAADYLRQAAHVAQLKAVIAGGRAAGAGAWRATTGFGAVGATQHVPEISQRRDRDAGLDAELAELKRRFGRV
jgi:hypothetical protein